MKVLMTPHITQYSSEESGIRRVVEAYSKYLPQFDIELVHPESNHYDLKAVHISGEEADVVHLHGLYWSADFEADRWQHVANKEIVQTIRQAREVTVPSSWVAETFQRDMRFTPHIIPHGIEADEWQTNKNEGFVLWNKNRVGDVCSPEPLLNLATKFTDTSFVTTFAPKINTGNITQIGLLPHLMMKEMIEKCAVYLSTTKETFGIGALEAMAAGKPVLGWAHGGNLDLIEHGVNGYLAEPENYDDLYEGLNYCLTHQGTLGDNGKEMAKRWTWEKACEAVSKVYFQANIEQEDTITIVIPVYNKSISELERAIDSCLAQARRPDKIQVVDDGSENGDKIYKFVNDKYGEPTIEVPVYLLQQNNQGVARARNIGISGTQSTYIVCLDADDWIEPEFTKVCLQGFQEDRSLDIAYTGLYYHKPDGEEGLSPWPTEWNFDRHMQKAGQVPTCCMFKREMWVRLGGYKQRYAPEGAGAEDAEFWLRAGAYGFKAGKVSGQGLFHYSWLSGQVTGDKDYREVDWLAWHPWTKDYLHPFASYATPKNRVAHLVRQYDEPVVSVIIPLGKDHLKTVIDSLDSIEAQTFRKWEVIIAYDTFLSDENWAHIRVAYPYIRYVEAYSRSDTGLYIAGGPGKARNKGVEIARASLILFLDADDTLHPDALEKMIAAYQHTGEAIYTDYVGQAFIDLALAKKLQAEGRLQSFNEVTGEAIMNHKHLLFDCERAQQQPNLRNPFIWNLITTLLPKQWHFDINGFDEEMETWEDWDYWVRMAMDGKCFHHLAIQLVRYRFHTGKRREKALSLDSTGRQIAENVVEYLQAKYQEITKVGCGCNQVKESIVTTPDPVGDFVKAVYTGRRGKHGVTGAALFPSRINKFKMRKRGKEFSFDYGHTQQGDRRLVHLEDVSLMVGKWQPEVQEVAKQPEHEIVIPSAPTRLTIPETPIQWYKLPGVSPTIIKEMKGMGLTTKEAIREIGVEGLIKIKYVGQKRAEAIVEYVNN